MNFEVNEILNKMAEERNMVNGLIDIMIEAASIDNYTENDMERARAIFKALKAIYAAVIMHESDEDRFYKNVAMRAYIMNDFDRLTYYTFEEFEAMLNK
jgi:hypothetical protein